MSEQNVHARVVFPHRNEREAEIVYNSLRVDKEPKRGGTERTMSLEGSSVAVEWTAKDARSLRLSINNFLDLYGLVTQTITEFGPPLNTDNGSKDVDSPAYKRNKLDEPV